MSVKLRVYIQPNASKSEMCGEYDDSLKVKVSAPAVDGKANKALIAFLAKSLKIKKNDISIKSGESSRRKILVLDMCEDDLCNKLNLEEKDMQKFAFIL